MQMSHDFRVEFEFNFAVLWLVDQSSPFFFPSNIGVIVVDNAVVRLSMSSSVPEIFAIEVKIVPSFVAGNFKGAGPTNFHPSCFTSRGQVW